MMKKIAILFISLLFISCGSSKIRTTKKATSTKSYPVTKKNPDKTAPVGSSKETKSPGSEILVATSKVKATTEDVKKYISDFKETAKSNMKSHGVRRNYYNGTKGDFRIGCRFWTISQKANNHFGIKCHTGWTGESVKYDDDAEQECFRKYKDQQNLT